VFGGLAGGRPTAGRPGARGTAMTQTLVIGGMGGRYFDFITQTPFQSFGGFAFRCSQRSM